jgi:hypothetical protein
MPQNRAGKEGHRGTRILRAYRTDGEYHRCFIAEPGKLNVRRLQEMRELSRKDTRAEAREMHANPSCVPHERGGGGRGALYCSKEHTNVRSCAYKAGPCTHDCLPCILTSREGVMSQRFQAEISQKARGTALTGVLPTLEGEGGAGEGGGGLKQ